MATVDSRIANPPPAGGAVRPSFGEAFRLWLKLGCINFGGPAGQIAMMHRMLVDEKKWIDEPRFLHALNFCMVSPGPEAQKLATYIGWLLHGIRGGLAAVIGYVVARSSPGRLGVKADVGALAAPAPDRWRQAVTASVTGLAAWWTPVVLAVVALGPDHVLVRIGTFFSKLAVVSFGGAY